MGDYTMAALSPAGVFFPCGDRSTTTDNKKAGFRKMSSCGYYTNTTKMVMDYVFTT